MVARSFRPPRLLDYPVNSPELVSKRLGNYQFHPVWDFIADQAWVR